MVLSEYTCHSVLLFVDCRHVHTQVRNVTNLFLKPDLADCLVNVLSVFGHPCRVILPPVNGVLTVCLPPFRAKLPLEMPSAEHYRNVLPLDTKTGGAKCSCLVKYCRYVQFNEGVPLS